MRDIGKNIKTLRTKKGLTQDQLAEQLFITRQTVSNYEIGKSRPDIDMLIRIAETLNTDIHALLYGPQQKMNRRKEWQILTFTGSIAAVLGVFLFFFHRFATDRQNQFYDVNAAAWLSLVFLPLYLPYLGWTLMNAMGTLLKTKPLQHRCVPLIRRIILVLLVLYGLTIVLQWIQILFRIPALRFLNMMLFRVTVTLTKFPALFMLPGIALWLCGFPVQKTQ